MDRGVSPIRIWLAIAGVATLIIGGSYTMVQQSERLGANDLPTIGADTIKHSLASGSNPKSAVNNYVVDLGNAQTTNTYFSIITDNNREVLASDVALDGQTPVPPQGVFDYTAAHGEDNVTWQPKAGVRLALHATTYRGGFIFTGQSLKLAEKKIDTYTILAAAAWLAALIWAWLILMGLDGRLIRPRAE